MIDNERLAEGGEKNRGKYLVEPKNCSTFALGEVAEWSIAAVLKTVELRGSGGSNPSLSANDRKVGWVANECLQPFLFSGWTNLSGAV